MMLPDQALEARLAEGDAALRRREREVAAAEARAEALLDTAAADIEAQEAETAQRRAALEQQQAAWQCALPSCCVFQKPTSMIKGCAPCRGAIAPNFTDSCINGPYNSLQ